MTARKLPVEFDVCSQTEQEFDTTYFGAQFTVRTDGSRSIQLDVESMWFQESDLTQLIRVLKKARKQLRDKYGYDAF